MEVRIGPLESCASCASGGAVRAISPDLSGSSISESDQSCMFIHLSLIDAWIVVQIGFQRPCADDEAGL